MADIVQLKSQIKEMFLVSGSPEGPSAFSEDSDAPEYARSAQKLFSAFDPSDQQRSAALLLRVTAAFQAADQAEDGVDAALGVLREAATDGDLQMAQHVLGIFATHASKLRSGTFSLPIPPLVFKAPDSDGPMPFSEDEEDDEGGVGVGPVGEAALHWFREDIHLNEHHRHWHMVYSTTGIPSGPQQNQLPVRMKSRQGEVFIYMHRQMIARYETERMIAGLEPVTPLNDFSEPLGAGYDPDGREPKFLGYSQRSDEMIIHPDWQTVLNERRDNFATFLASGAVGGTPIALNANTVGCALESSLSLVGDRFDTMQSYDNARNIVNANLQLHNFGHGAIASDGARPGDNSPPGVMGNPHTSLQDPIFWRWHLMIDNLAERYYEGLDDYDLSASPISLEPEDGNAAVIVLSETDLTDVSFDQDDREGLRSTLSEKLTAAFSANADGSSELRTGTVDEQFKFVGSPHPGGVANRRFAKTSLMSERFVIGVRAISEEARSATARVFVCTDAFLDLDGSPVDGDADRQARRAAEHRRWIEIDRQPVELEAGETMLAFLSDESSIVRKLAGRAIWPTAAITEADFDALHQNANGSADDYCDCGWPINLLLPRGSQAGTGFQMVVMVSDGIPTVGKGECGSRSFCGSEFDGYPELDEINMGFPFDRPASHGTIDLIQRSPNMAMRSITIRHDPNLWASMNPGA